MSLDIAGSASREHICFCLPGEELGRQDHDGDQGQDVNHLVHAVRLLVEVLIVQRLGPIHLHHIRHMSDYQSIHHELKESEACS